MAYQAYGKSLIKERHRHRYEINSNYVEHLENFGMFISGSSLDGQLVEVVEIPDHPWFVASQFHPEFISTPKNPAPLFDGFIKGCLEYKNNAQR
jgi:CTP synthase